MEISYEISSEEGVVEVYAYCFASCYANVNCGNGSADK